MIFERMVILLDDSKPVHLTNFSAECFSFVARDTKNKRELIYMITAAVGRNPSLSTGCGRLLLEIMRGTNQKFHSCAEQYWNLLLEMISENASTENGYDPRILFGILIQTVTDMLQCIEPTSMKQFWIITYQAMDKHLIENQMSNEEGFHYVLQLAGLALEYQHGKFLDDISAMIGKLVKTIGATDSEQILLSVTKIATIMLNSKYLNITQLQASRLTKNIMTIGSRSPKILRIFVLSVIECSIFENLVFPDFQKHAQKNFDLDTLQILVKIVMNKSPMSWHGINLTDWKQFPVLLKSNKVTERIWQLLKGYQPEDRPEFFMYLILLPHLKDFPIDERLIQAVETEVKVVLDDIEDNFENYQLFALNLLVETLVHLKSSEVCIFLNTIKRLLPIISMSKNESFIGIVNICLVQISQENLQFLDEALFEIVHSNLCDFLASVHHQTRLLVAHSFALFGHLKKLKIKDENKTVFDLLFNIENIETDIHTYREQVVLLKKLEFDAKFFQAIRENTFRLDIMRFVLSMFSINFKLLWEYAEEVLQSYADNFSISDFWTVYKRQLDFLLTAVCVKSVEKKSEFIEKDTMADIEDVFLFQHKKIDFVNVRVQLLVMLSKFSRIFEAMNREIVESFIHFIETEYRIKQAEKSVNDETPKATQKILIAYLNIFASMKSPKTIFKAQQLYELFLEFLTHRSHDVQKLALDCIFTYDNASLTPYKDNLYRLNNDKTVKQEIANFFTESIDAENTMRCVVLEEDRFEVIPLVIKIVHTKMVQKNNSIEMKNLLLRFVGNFREEEINLFLNMSFDYFEKLLKSNPLATYENIKASEYDFEEDLPIHRLQTLIRFMDSIREEFAGVKNKEFNRHLLHIKLCIDSIILKIEHTRVKQLKSETTLNMVNFFEQFDVYEWSDEEIETLFHIYVWPSLDKLPLDCIHSPTPLLKLFMAWSRNPRYYLLLSKINPSSTVIATSTPLVKIIDLLKSEKASDNICQQISKMITNMITLESTESDSSLQKISSTHPSDELEASNFNLNLGSRMLLPYYKDILGHIQKSMKRKRTINKDHLLILSRVTEFIKEEELCNTLADMLFPLAIRKLTLPNIDTESMRNIHAALISLLGLVSKPEQHIRSIGLLLERAKDHVSRKSICEMIQLVASKSEKTDLIRCACIIEDMNAMDKRWLEQPDYKRRLGAFRSVDHLTEYQDTIDMNLVILFVHQCFHHLKADQDLAMRGNANHYLRKIIIKTIKMHKIQQQADVQYLVQRVVLVGLMNGVKDSNETTRNESVQLLGDLSRECAEYHPVFSDLHSFTNSADREVDFFDNMVHLQVHRHRRAMMRFCKVIRNLEKLPSNRTMVDFVLPIMSMYICSEKYRKKSKLTEAAGKCISIIGRLLPWPSYRALLKQYLNKMKNNIEYQKQLIKIVVSLLDNFHFDLSNADTNCLQNNVELNCTNQTTEGISFNSEDIENEYEVTTCYGNNGLKTVSISFTHTTVLKKEDAISVVADISNVIIPDLFSTINYKESQGTHKLNERKERYAREKKEMLKIPVAIAIVKLLHKLPEQFIENNLPKLFIRVINFLKSNLKQIRSTARETLKTIMLSVEPVFLKSVLEILSSVLTRGFQVHVLIATVFTILDAMQERLNSSIVDDILQLVTTFCINDIFGRISEEKEIFSVTNKIPEAKPSKKSFLILQILSRHISEKSILDIILPFKEILIKTNTKKTVSKVQEVLNKIAEGICTNQYISVEARLILVFGIISESIPNLAHDSNSLSTRQKEQNKLVKQDVYIIPPEPKRRGMGNIETLANVSKANSHVLVEMGLVMLYMMIKKNNVLSVEYEQFLEPMIPILVDSMSSNHSKISILGIKCIASVWSSRIHISCLEQHINKIVDNLLEVLHKYATATIGRNDDNYQLVKHGFKAVVALLKFVKYYTIGSEQLKLLLIYVEHDLNHPDQQKMALILLRSIIGRKLIAKEMASIIKQVAEFSINSNVEKFRAECRRVVLEYLLSYPLGPKVELTIQFYVNQLEYEVLSGRESAVLMLKSMFTAFPTEFLYSKGSVIFLSLGIRLINEQSSSCRALVADALEALLIRLGMKYHDELIEFILILLQNKKLNHRELGAQFITRLITVEKESFATRVDKIFPALLSSLNDLSSESAGKFVRIKRFESQDENDKEAQKMKDHSLFQTLNVLNQMVEACPEIVSNSKYSVLMDELAYSLQALLSYGHQWVRFGALQLLGVILSAIKTDSIFKTQNSNEHSLNRRFIYSYPHADIRSLVLDMCSQLNPGETDDATAQLIAQNLLLITSILREIPLETSNVGNKNIDLKWILRRVRYVIQSEVAKSPKSISLRKNMFQLMEAIVNMLDGDVLICLASSMLSPALRELTDKDHVNDEIKQIVERLGIQIKTKIGKDQYDSIVLTMHSKIEEKRRARQQNNAIDKINNPLHAAKRKMADKFRKKEAKKRKVDMLTQVGKRVFNEKSKGKRKNRRLEDLFQST
ncbi:small subunit processome component 20 homolog isoform X2 [Malaya genurostris]|nr:small subunit processome component 20 homolog isoform X2 [Malaya genurostris]